MLSALERDLFEIRILRPSQEVDRSAIPGMRAYLRTRKRQKAVPGNEKLLTKRDMPGTR